LSPDRELGGGARGRPTRWRRVGHGTGHARAGAWRQTLGGRQGLGENAKAYRPSSPNVREDRTIGAIRDTAPLAGGTVGVPVAPALSRSHLVVAALAGHHLPDDLFAARIGTITRDGPARLAADASPPPVAAAGHGGTGR